MGHRIDLDEDKQKELVALLDKRSLVLVSTTSRSFRSMTPMKRTKKDEDSASIRCGRRSPASRLVVVRWVFIAFSDRSIDSKYVPMGAPFCFKEGGSESHGLIQHSILAIWRSTLR